MTKEFASRHNKVKMKSVVKLPLYLGFFVLVFAVILSAVKIGEKGSVTQQLTRATTGKASLALKFSSPNQVTIVLTSDKEVAGIDVALKYEKDKIKILPSTLSGSPKFTTTGGLLDEEKSVFSFSALAKEPVTSSLVASFQVRPKEGTEISETSLQFVTGEGESAVIEKSSTGNILSTAQGVKFTLSVQ